VAAIPLPLTSKESNMMEELTHPVVLSDEELELVAAGGGSSCGCSDGSALVNVENVSILNGSLNDNNVAVGVGSIILQS
jgi:hypothetical protein